MASNSGDVADLGNAKALLTAAASIAGTVVLARSVANDIFPPVFRSYFFNLFCNFFNRCSSKLTMVIHEMDGFGPNQIYDAAEAYLATKVSPSTNRIQVTKPENEHAITTAMETDQEVTDTFDGVRFHWLLVCKYLQTQTIHNSRLPFQSTIRSFELSFHKKHREMVLESYLPYILHRAKELKQQMRTLKIFTFDPRQIYDSYSNLWIPTNLDHPATFQKLAMDPEVKDFIIRDLERFVQRKEFYREVGKAWKRGYLLYGPPGTGKSSLIAAIANYLKFDVYDLELTEIQSNSDLRKLLIGVANRSILVVEDIDCSIEFHDREQSGLIEEENQEDRPEHRWRKSRVTLSGLLNFIDGLWSSCGNERIVIFTTNHKEKLDPALLRPGRMDVHVHMSYCSPDGFRVLAWNYLGIDDHELFGEIEERILSRSVTPAEVAEQLLKGDDGDTGISHLMEFLGA